jgi:hypothetical protein
VSYTAWSLYNSHSARWHVHTFIPPYSIDRDMERMILSQSNPGSVRRHPPSGLAIWGTIVGVPKCLGGLGLVLSVFDISIIKSSGF